MLEKHPSNSFLMKHDAINAIVGVFNVGISLVIVVGLLPQHTY